MHFYKPHFCRVYGDDGSEQPSDDDVPHLTTDKPEQTKGTYYTFVLMIAAFRTKGTCYTFALMMSKQKVHVTYLY